MHAMPYTYLAKRQYWRFRHPSLGDVPIEGEPFGEAFMARYRTLLKASGGVVRESLIDRLLRLNANPENFYRLYFIGAAREGPIKIGIAKSPKQRLMQLQVGNPAALVLLGETAGGRIEEKTLHRMFAQDRIGGEWYARSDALLAEISRRCGGRLT